MTIKEILLEGQSRLKTNGIPLHESWLEAEILLAHILKKDRTWLIAHTEMSVSTRKQETFFRLIMRRENHEPVAYLLGRKEFYGLSFAVNRHVLIPRPETEEMIHLLSARYSILDTRYAILDVGTGSGVLGITAKHLFPKASIMASDVSKRALTLAKKNADRLLAKNHRIYFIQGSLLDKNIKTRILKSKPTTLIILANLPYLPISDKNLLSKDVVNFEPPAALFAKEDGKALLFQLLKQLRSYTKKHALSLQAFFEFDPPQANVLKKYAMHVFSEATVLTHKDLSGRDRFLQIIQVRQTHDHRS